ncbi:hypothetical protein ACIQZB_20250 [Streptomyces sp. NPDC097727]|uniref:hypothetical protein n=1 Tax=Streptomyces sp. NPDC097727 TaxID=3366092 RepID=UPI0038123AD3
MDEERLRRKSEAGCPGCRLPGPGSVIVGVDGFDLARRAALWAAAEAARRIGERRELVIGIDPARNWHLALALTEYGRIGAADMASKRGWRTWFTSRPRAVASLREYGPAVTSRRAISNRAGPPATGTRWRSAPTATPGD